MGYIQPLLIRFVMKTTIRFIASALGVFALSGATLLAQESVTIPMATYQDLLDRLDSLEKRVSQAETRGQSAPARVSTPTSSGKSIDDEIVYLPNPSKAVTMPSRGGLYTNYEYVHAKPVYSSATAFYVHDNVVTASESAELYEFRPDMEGSHRLELGYLNPVTNIGWRTRYWQFSSDSRLESPRDADVKVGIADDPDIAIDSVGTGDDYYIATAGTDLDVIDLERFERKASAGKATTVGFGARYARVQNYYTGRDVDPVTGDDEILRHFNSFQGAGPTISIDMQRQIGNSKLSWDFGGRASALFGSSRARWEADYTPGGELSDVIDHGENIRVLPVTEAQLGLLYEHETRRGKFIDVGAGFEGQYWLGGGTPLDAGQDSATDSDHISTPSSHNLGILGFYFKVGAEF